MSNKLQATLPNSGFHSRFLSALVPFPCNWSFATRTFPKKLSSVWPQTTSNSGELELFASPHPLCGLKMGSAQKYSLKWNDFTVNVASTFRDLHTRSDFVDVTLACSDGSTLDAHKVILSSVSSYFRDVLKVR